MDSQAIASTPEQIQEKYRLVGDLLVPTFDELKTLFSLYGGELSRHRSIPNYYALELPGKTLCGKRELIWDWYRAHKKALDAMRDRSTAPF